MLAMRLVLILPSSRKEPHGAEARLNTLVEARVTLYNVFQGDYNRVEGEKAAQAFSPILFSPLPAEVAIMSQPIYLSGEGLEKLKSELEHLRTVGRHDVAEQIQQSRERGGIVSNAEYEEAKNELAFTEGRILTLDNLVNNAVIIEETQGDRDTVEVGATVSVKDQNGKSFKYTITGSTEADPSQGKISNVSPIGKCLLGKRVGEVTEVNVPSGKIRLEILSIG